MTASLASTFIILKHNVTELNATDPQSVLYSSGPKDLCLIFFYTVVAVIYHAIIQEYILDKLMRKIRLSKTRSNKFNESGQLFAFYITSIICAGYIFHDGKYFHTLSYFWTGYPHTALTFLTKIFFIMQISYWLHSYPELYFQKVKKEDRAAKIHFATLNLFICTAIYYLNFTRIGLLLLVIDYAVSALFHISRILYFMGKESISKISFKIYNVFFILARLAEIILSVFVFWFGLSASSIDSVNFEERNFNTPMVRIACLGVILALQALMMWNFVLFQLKKMRENVKPSKLIKSTPKKTKSQKDGNTSDVVESDDGSKQR